MTKERRDTEDSRLQDAVATAEVLFSLGLSEARAIAGDSGNEARTAFARRLCTAVLRLVWQKRCEAAKCNWELRTPVETDSKRFPGLVERLAGALATISPPRAGFLAGQLYTALLPDEVRKSLGAFYTPPPLVDRLLELVTESGFDWSRGRIIDPACGGAAFLASVAPKLVENSRARSPFAVVADVEARLAGIEIDPFAAWMAMVLLDIALIDITKAAKRRLNPVVLARDALEIPANDLDHFDLVIGNPPYGKVTLSGVQRQSFRQSLFGHANLYGVFTELAVRLTKEGGLIAYVTPTSFLGGEYFKNLRKLLSNRAPLRRLDFVSDREGVFEGVLQETMLALFERSPERAHERVTVSVLRSANKSEPLKVERVGEVKLNGTGAGPWVIPRSADQLHLVACLNSMPHRLSNYGFGVATGQLVWNRHKDQLCASYEEGCYPIIWAEAVGMDGRFEFQAARRSHLPYLKLKPAQDFLLNREPCILVQRTTAKEQRRRIVAAVIPNSFVLEYPGFIVENHLNMVYSISSKPTLALRTVSALLNSGTLDEAFRCINGSVAVSAFELNSLPLPNPEQMRALQSLVLSDAPSADVEDLIAIFYKDQHEPARGTATIHLRQHHRKLAACGWTTRGTCPTLFLLTFTRGIQSSCSSRWWRRTGP